MFRKRRPTVPSDERWRLTRDELSRLQNPRGRVWRVGRRFVKPVIAVVLFVLTLSFSGVLWNSSPAPIVHQIVSELDSIRVDSAIGHPDAHAAKETIRDAMARLEALSLRVQQETRLNDTFKERLLADIHREWQWWHSALHGEPQPARASARRK